MLDNKILMTGGSGLLGRELQKYIRCNAPDSKTFNILNEHTMTKYAPDIVIHCAAYTNVARAEGQKKECFEMNVLGTYNLVKLFPKAYFVYISTEYALNPVNFYASTKKWGEEIVQTYSDNHMIVRSLFKARPYPYEYAFFDQYTYGHYVDIIAPMIASFIMQKRKGIQHVMTEKKSMFELARMTRPEIKGISVDDIKDVKLPKMT